MATQEEKNKLNQMVSELRTEISSLKIDKSNGDKHQKRCAELESKLQLVTSNVVSNEDVQILEGENKALKLKIKVKEDDIELLNKQIELKSDEISMLEKKISCKAFENEQLLSKKQELMKEVLTLETRIKSELTDLQHEVSLLKNKNQLLTFEIEKSRKNYSNLQNQNCDLQKIEYKNAEYVKQLRELKRNKNELADELKQATKKLEDSENRVNDLEIQLSYSKNIEEQNAKLRSNSMLLETKNVELQAEIVSLSQNNQFFKEKEKSNSELNTKSMLQLNKLQDENVRLKTELKALKVDIED